MKYLVRYTCCDETFWELMTMQQLANSVGCRDFNECENHCAWRLLPNAEPQPVKIRDVSKYHEIWLFDRFDNFIESGSYPEH